MTMLTKSTKEKKQKNIIIVYKSLSEGLSLGTLLAKFSNHISDQFPADKNCLK